MSAAPTETPVPLAARSGRPNVFLVIATLPFIGVGLFLMGKGLEALLGEEPGIDAVMQVSCGFIAVAMGWFGLWAAFREGRDDRVGAELRRSTSTE